MDYMNQSSVCIPKIISLVQHSAQQSVHLTLGILRQSQTVFYALAFFWLDGFAVPTPAQVTQTVGRWREKIQNPLLKNLFRKLSWFFIGDYFLIFHFCVLLA